MPHPYPSILRRIDLLDAEARDRCLEAVHNRVITTRAAGEIIGAELGTTPSSSTIHRWRHWHDDGKITIPHPRLRVVGARLTKAGLDRSLRGLRVVTLDIKTSPMTVHAFAMWGRHTGLNQVVEHGDILSVGYKWLGNPVEHVARWDESGYDEMIRRVHSVLDEANVLVTYNGTSFDEKKLNWAFARAGLDRPSPYKNIDLLRVIRARFAPDSEKIDHVAQMLGLGNKLSTGAFDLWRGSMTGDTNAQARMTRQCKQDVRLTEKLYLRLLPWLPASVNLPQIAGANGGCPTCGSSKVSPTPKAHSTAATSYELLKCGNCRTWIRSSRLPNRTGLRVA